MIDYLNIGLDFGTHQSKVCIEDTSDPRNRFYTFFKFLRPDGTDTFFLPSVVQINSDKTLSYGFIDESRALVLGKKHTFPEPAYIKPPLPKLEVVPEEPIFREPLAEEAYINALPVRSRYKTTIIGITSPTGKRSTRKITKDMGHQRYLKYLAAYKEKYRENLEKWQTTSGLAKRINAVKMQLYEAECKKIEQEFLKKHKYWESSLSDNKAIYRYFKISTFAKNTHWEGDISPKLLSTWYLTYVFFCIFEKYPDEISFQMGIPESIGEPFAKEQRKTAEDIFYTAYQLYKFFGSKEEYLKASVDYLSSITRFNTVSNDYSHGSQVLALPEAFAGLLTITQQGKISIGMNLLVDIGGGSTDISLFNVIEKRSEKLPNISRIISIHRGLNYIYSLYKETHYEMSIEEIRSMFEKDPSAFKNEIEVFRKELVAIVNKELFEPLSMAAMKRRISMERLLPIIENRPVIFTGGGGVYDAFHKSIHLFTEPISVSKDLLSLNNVTEKHISDDELSILAVAYGLSIPQVKEPDMTPISQLFGHINLQKDQSVLGNGYEHGLSDL